MASTDKKATDPDAVAEARERVAQAKAGVSPTAEVPAAAPGGNATVTPQPDTEAIKRLEAENAELRKKLDALNGEVGSRVDRMVRAKLAETDERIRLLAEENAAQKKALEESKPAAPPQPMQAGEREQYLKGVPGETRGVYADDLADMIVTISRNVFRIHGSEVVKPVEEKLRAEQELNEEERALQAIEAKAPGFMEYNGVPSRKIPAKPEWTEFLDSDCPTCEGRTWRDYLAWNSSTSEIAKAFKQFQSQGNLARKPIVAIEGQVAPVTAGAAPSAESAGSPKPKGTWGEYQKIKDELQHGRPEGMGIDEFNKKMGRFKALQDLARAGELK